MLNLSRYLRGCVYPRSGMSWGVGSVPLRGSDIILGMTAVMLVVVSVALLIQIVLF
jgi:hypothetical protein